MKGYLSKGFTLVEMLIAVVIFGMITAQAAQFFINQTRVSKNYITSIKQRQDVCNTIDYLIYEIRMAGYNPRRISFCPVTFDTTKLIFCADLDGNGAIDGKNEWIQYCEDSVSRVFLRITKNDTDELFEGVQRFMIEYRDSLGQEIHSPSDESKIRQVKITITGNYPLDAQNAGHVFKTYRMESLIVPRNLNE
jgi:prepilin-type N-terminal cleavage/methylation domain-containing protein